MTHEDVWRALDTLAAENGLSPSGLARRAGLHATAFNPSKRRTPDGRARWPNTESLAKVLEATGASLELFAHLVAGQRTVVSNQNGRLHRIPVIGIADARQAGAFDTEGLPAGESWREISVLEISDPHAYALEIDGDLAEPVFRNGQLVVVSPSRAICRNDRVIVRTVTGEVIAREVVLHSPRKLALRSFGPDRLGADLGAEQVAWMHRIIWAGQ